MTDQLIPPERLEFYNAFGREIVASAIEAIDDAVEELAGHRGDEALRAEIHEIIRRAWDASGPDYTSPPLAEATVRICLAIERSTGRDVVNELGVTVWNEVHRAYRDLVEALANIHRDVLIDLGAHPDKS